MQEIHVRTTAIDAQWVFLPLTYCVVIYYFLIITF